MANQRIDEDQEALFHSYPCADYYVQSPSSVSHANSTDCRNHDSTFLSSYPLESFNPNPSNPCQEVSRLTLSRYSSSRGSNNSFLHEKKISYDLNSHGNGTGSLGIHPICGIEEAEEEDCEDDFKRRPGLLSFGYSSSWVCVSFQILLRLVVSFGISLLVFFLVTRPPPPKISVKVWNQMDFKISVGILVHCLMFTYQRLLLVDVYEDIRTIHLVNLTKPWSFVGSTVREPSMEMHGLDRSTMYRWGFS